MLGTEEVSISLTHTSFTKNSRANTLKACWCKDRSAHYITSIFNSKQPHSLDSSHENETDDSSAPQQLFDKKKLKLLTDTPYTSVSSTKTHDQHVLSYLLMHRLLTQLTL